MPSKTFYPDAHPESTSVDGKLREIQIAGVSWATLIGGSGSSASDAAESEHLHHIANKYDETDKWSVLERAIFLFDTSYLPDNTIKISAILSFYGMGKTDTLGITPNVNIYSSAPASNTVLVAGDFNSLGSTPLCDTPISYNNWNTSGYNDFVLNADGLAAISKTGITKFGTRNASYDVANSAPTWVSGAKVANISAYNADKGGNFRPKLVVTYSAVVPEVTTDLPSDKANTTATINGTLDEDGGEDCTVRFQWGTTTAYGNTTADQTKSTGESFSQGLTGLSGGTTYHYRAMATNSNGTSYGVDRAFILGTVVYPSEPLARVTNLIHRYSPGSYTLEIALGEVTSDFGLPVFQSSPRKALPDEIPTCGPGYILAWSIAAGWHCVPLETVM